MPGLHDRGGTEGVDIRGIHLSVKPIQKENRSYHRCDVGPMERHSQEHNAWRTPRTLFVLSVRALHPYQLVVGFPERNASSTELLKDADRFFSSFRVAGNQ
jgi:hypothetical protein